MRGALVQLKFQQWLTVVKLRPAKWWLCVNWPVVILIIFAYRLADPSSFSPFEYFGIALSFFSGWVIFAEASLDRLIPGALLIVGGGLLIAWREHLKKILPKNHARSGQ